MHADRLRGSRFMRLEIDTEPRRRLAARGVSTFAYGTELEEIAWKRCQIERRIVESGSE